MAISNIVTIFVTVEQQVKDINKTLSSLVSEIQSLGNTVDSQYAEICQLNRNADKLLKGNRELLKRLGKSKPAIVLIERLLKGVKGRAL